MNSQRGRNVVAWRCPFHVARTALLVCMSLILGVSGIQAQNVISAASTYPLTVTAIFQSGSGTAFTEKIGFNLVVQ